MIPIASREAKAVLADYLAETCPEHLEFLKTIAGTFGRDMVIEFPEDPVLRSKLEDMKNAR